MADRPARVLAIGGSDSGGGAGVQADIKTITTLGGYATCAITAVTAQNTLGVQAIHLLPSAIIEAQARAVLDDIGADAIKIGMLGEGAAAAAVARVLATTPALPVVLDPVMIATAGTRLANQAALAILVRDLIPRAALLTPNAIEAGALTGLEVRTLADQRRAGETLLRAGASAVLVKGGHIGGERLTDVLMHAGGERLYHHPRLTARHTHGTGCTLASACATGLAQGLGLEDAVGMAIDYIARAIAEAPGLGAGRGPVGHAAAAPA